MYFLLNFWKLTENVIFTVIYGIFGNCFNEIECHFCSSWVLAFFQHVGVHSSLGRALQLQCHGLKSKWNQILFFFPIIAYM